jgi:hypothetical protein
MEGESQKARVEALLQKARMEALPQKGRTGMELQKGQREVKPPEVLVGLMRKGLMVEVITTETPTSLKM